MTPTPAPWTVTVWDQTVFIHGGPDNDDIADFSFADQHTVSISKDEAIANATLCAGAHDLLEALKDGLSLAGGWREAIVELEDWCHEPVRLKNMLAAADQLDRWAAAARAAISKATTVAP